MLAAQALRGSPISTSAPVPLPTPYAPKRVTAADLGLVDPGADLMVYVLGDSGGVAVPTPQMAVARIMAQLAATDKPAFGWHVGDWGYFGCDWAAWLHQVQEPYAALRVPLLGIPGNHDDARGGDPPIPDLATRPPLDVWMAAMCSAKPTPTPGDPDNEFGRPTETQPSHDWTLALDALTIIGVWSNVPSGGHLFPEQVAWLTSELQSAPTDRPLALSIHHPPLSIDTHHGGSQRIFDALSAAFTAAKRVPDVILCGHVHDDQRFSWSVAGGTTTVIVTGNGGYHNLHPIAADYSPGMTVEPGVVCQFADASRYGFVRLRTSGGKLRGEYVGVDLGVKPDGSDSTARPGLDVF